MSDGERIAREALAIITNPSSSTDEVRQAAYCLAYQLSNRPDGAVVAIRALLKKRRA